MMFFILWLHLHNPPVSIVTQRKSDDRVGDTLIALCTPIVLRQSVPSPYMSIVFESNDSASRSQNHIKLF
jgi:hypothetical protein